MVLWYYHATMFHPIRSRNLSDEIVDQIILLILTGKLAPGEKLPSERALARSLNVGRNGVREALTKLQAMDVIKVRRPQGAFVQFLSPKALGHPLSRFLELEIDGVLNFLDVRKWLEGMTAAEAGERATEEDIREIEATLSKIEAAAAQKDREALDASDMAFHVAVMNATQNPLMIYLVDTFQSLMWSSHGIRTVILEASDLDLVFAEHRAVADAIRARAPELARDAMMHHIEMIRNRVERLYERTRTKAGGDGHG